MKPRILVVDDQYARIGALREDFLRVMGCAGPGGRYEFEFCSGQVNGRNSVDCVLAKVREGWPPSADRPFWSLVLLDVRFDSVPPSDEDETFGIRILEALRRLPETQAVPVVMLTDREDARGQAGLSRASGFLSKRDLRADGDGAAALDLRAWRHGLLEDDRPEGQRLVGRSTALLDALREARVYALDRLGSLIIFGETGTGKTELARYVHHWSRREGEFIKWTAETKDPGIAKAELQGWWRGAHNQAERSQAGEIEKAHQGTFFLDEVAYLTPDLQGLLIDVRRRDERGMRTIGRMGTMPTRDTRQETVRQALESVVGELEMGQTRGRPVPTGRIKVDVLFVSATNVDLWDEQERKRCHFRVDLLNDLGRRVVMPSLNQQREDIPLLFYELLWVARQRQSPPGSSFRVVNVGRDVDDYLKSLDWKDKNVVTLKAIAEASISGLGPDFDVVSLDHVHAAASNVGMDGGKGSAYVSVAVSDAESVMPVVKPPLVRHAEASTLEALIDQINTLEIPTDQTRLKGVLPLLQETYARLVLRLLGAALRATHRSGGFSTLEAVRLLLDRKELRPDGEGDATKAYDVVKRLVLLADTTFSRRGARGCPVLSEDELVKEHVSKANKR